MGAVPFADPTRVFPERDVELPVQLVLNAPMAAHGCGKFLGGQIAAGDVEPRLDAILIAGLAFPQGDP